MKIDIYYLNSKLTTEIKKDFLVKDLLYDLKQYLSTTDNFILFDKNYIQLKESDNISTKKEKQLILYLVKSSPNKNNLINSEKKEKKTENLNALQLIKECTGAKKPLDLKSKLTLNPSNRFGIFELLDNRNNNNPQQGENHFERLLNLLQILEDNNQLGGFRGGQMNNNAPVEADEKSLRELQEMGFPEDRARQALINARNDINRATEILLGETGE